MTPQYQYIAFAWRNILHRGNVPMPAKSGKTVLGEYGENEHKMVNVNTDVLSLVRQFSDEFHPWLCHLQAPTSVKWNYLSIPSFYSENNYLPILGLWLVFYFLDFLSHCNQRNLRLNSGYTASEREAMHRNQTCIFTVVDAYTAEAANNSCKAFWRLHDIDITCQVSLLQQGHLACDVYIRSRAFVSSLLSKI